MRAPFDSPPHEADTARGIQPGNRDSNPVDLTVAGPFLFFGATNEEIGAELFFARAASLNHPDPLGWIDIVPGHAGSKPVGFESSGGQLPVYFSAQTESHGRELWISDATAAGTKMVPYGDIMPGARSSNPRFLTWYKGDLYFSAEDEQHGCELFKFDVGRNRVALVRDVRKGLGGSYPSFLTVMSSALTGESFLYFAATDGLYVQGILSREGLGGKQMWVSNGDPSPKGTHRAFQRTDNDLSFDPLALNEAWPARMGVFHSALYLSGRYGRASNLRPKGFPLGGDNPPVLQSNADILEGISQAAVIRDVDSDPSDPSAVLEVELAVSGGLLALPAQPPLRRVSTGPSSEHAGDDENGASSTSTSTSGVMSDGASSTRSFKPLYFLVVEDETIDRTLIANALRRRGHVVDVVTDGEEAYQLIVDKKRIGEAEAEAAAAKDGSMHSDSSDEVVELRDSPNWDGLPDATFQPNDPKFPSPPNPGSGVDVIFGGTGGVLPLSAAQLRAERIAHTAALRDGPYDCVVLQLALGDKSGNASAWDGFQLARMLRYFESQSLTGSRSSDNAFAVDTDVLPGSKMREYNLPPGSRSGHTTLVSISRRRAQILDEPEALAAGVDMHLVLPATGTVSGNAYSGSSGWPSGLSRVAWQDPATGRWGTTKDALVWEQEEEVERYAVWTDLLLDKVSFQYVGLLVKTADPGEFKEMDMDERESILAELPSDVQAIVGKVISLTGSAQEVKIHVFLSACLPVCLSVCLPAPHPKSNAHLLFSFVFQFNSPHRVCLYLFIGSSVMSLIIIILDQCSFAKSILYGDPGPSGQRNSEHHRNGPPARLSRGRWNYASTGRLALA
jgi:ELWxxDGT repeat protein